MPKHFVVDGESQRIETKQPGITAETERWRKEERKKNAKKSPLA